MIGIYKITNQVNNKIYIGQSKRIKERWQEHLRSGQPEKYSIKERDSKVPIHLAMQKYGVENFKFEIIEECLEEELNDKERYWISYYNSNNKEKGYNLTIGGQENFALKGEFHSQAKLTQRDVDQIKFLLKENKKSYTEILKLYPFITKGTISNINNGKNWKDNSEKYPLRPAYFGSQGTKNSTAKLNEKMVMEIRELYSKGISIEKIGKMYDIVSINTIKAVIYGKTWKNLPIWDNKNKKWI